MATGLTTTTQVDPAVNTFYDGVLLRRAKTYLAHHLFGQQRPIDQKSGDTAKFRRYTNLPVTGAPLIEGVTPTALQLAKSDFTVQLQQYGAYVEYTDKVSMINEDPVLTEIAGLLGDHAGETLDTVYREILVAGTSVFYANSVAGRTSIVTKLAAADFDKIKRALANNKAKYWTSSIKGGPGVGTLPIRAAYYCIVHPDVSYDLEGVLGTSFIHVSKYPDPASAHENEIGSYGPFRFIESTNAKIWTDGGGSAVAATLKYTTASSACDVYAILIFGVDAYGITPLKGKALENIVKPLGSGNDPLNQRGTSGWKAMTGAIILNQSWMYRYEVGVSA